MPKMKKTHLPFDIYVLVDYAEVFRNITLLEVFLSAVPIICHDFINHHYPVYSSVDD